MTTTQSYIMTWYGESERNETAKRLGYINGYISCGVPAHDADDEIYICTSGGTYRIPAKRFLRALVSQYGEAQVRGVSLPA